jgi:hypothetical protein
MPAINVTLIDGDKARPMQVHPDYDVGCLLSEADNELMRKGEIIVVQGQDLCDTTTHISAGACFQIVRDPDVIRDTLKRIFNIPGGIT